MPPASRPCASDPGRCFLFLHSLTCRISRAHRCPGQVMAGGPEAMEELQKDPETAELLQKLEKAMGGIMP